MPQKTTGPYPAPQDSFAHCPHCGIPASPDRKPRSFVCAACGFVLYFNIACAVGGLIVDQTGRLLLVRRAKGPSQGLLALPGGFVDPGETAEEALRREVREEVGLSVEIAAAIGSHQNAYSYKGITYPVLDFFYVCRTAGPVGNAADLTLQAAEVAGCEWRDPAGIQAHEIAFPSMHWAVERFRDSARLTAPR